MDLGRWPRVVAGSAVVALLTACAGDGLDEPTLSENTVQQVAASFATALDDLGALFLVGDPTTERLQVLRWEDDLDSAPARIEEQLGVRAEPFLRATAAELLRRAEDSVVTVETRVTATEPVGADETGQDWVRVTVAQDEIHADGHTTTTSTRYAIAVREGEVVEVREADGVLEETPPASTVRDFLQAVQSGDEDAVAGLLAEGVGVPQVAALRAWVAASGGFHVSALPAAQTGDLEVAYLVPARGPLVRFEVVGGTLSWEVVRP